MDEDCTRVSSAESLSSTHSSATKQKKKRKWDQPAESLLSAGVALPGMLPLGNVGSLVGIALPGITAVHNPSSANSIASGYVIPPVFPTQPYATAGIPKLNQPKIQDELIAKEIVINDADSAVRCKLTKRQTQEEIQRCTGAVVITRGKFRPPNAPLDCEKPLYLHISAGAHLDTTVERIKAVDRAAAMVEEILKSGSPNNSSKVSQTMSTCIYLGFDADPSLNVVARIRGPNDQYINHIMNETGATVLLKGRGSEDYGSNQGEEGDQPLHLLLSSNNSKSLEHAKLLAENLLDTISTEFGASRVSSKKVYGVVPPPQQLLTGVQNSGNESKINATDSGLTSTLGFVSAPLNPMAMPFSQGTTSKPMEVLNYGQSQSATISYPLVSASGVTSYSGYGGIYPQATPLQQLAQALKHSVSSATSTIAASTIAIKPVVSTQTHALSEEEKRPPQKRKFQELPVPSKVPAKSHQNSSQGSQLMKPCDPAYDLGAKDFPTIKSAKQLVQISSNGMPPPPPRLMSPSAKAMPPPPPKFSSTPPVGRVHECNTKNKPEAKTVSDTLVKLMEYGDEDDDLDDEIESLSIRGTPKPFWAV